MKLTRKFLEKYFGRDTSSGQTCTCNECKAVNQILEDQDKAREWDELMEKMRSIWK